MSSQPAKILGALNGGCHCCSTGVGHCPHCHDVPIHGVTQFGYVTVVEGIAVYWGDDKNAALDSARRGAGYVTLSPILADFRELAGRHDFRPVLATPFGDAVIPLDAVRSRRNTDGAGFDYQRDDADPVDWDAVFAFEQGVTAGVTVGRGRRCDNHDDDQLCPDCTYTPPETAPESTASVQHAEGIPEAPLRLHLP